MWKLDQVKESEHKKNVFLNKTKKMVMVITVGSSFVRCTKQDQGMVIHSLGKREEEEEKADWSLS